MRKVPSCLKGLAETRAPTAGDIEHLLKLKTLLEERLAEVQKMLSPCDALIRKFDERLDPNNVEAIRARNRRCIRRSRNAKIVHST